jgi:hypothetical protein
MDCVLHTLAPKNPAIQARISNGDNASDRYSAGAPMAPRSARSTLSVGTAAVIDLAGKKLTYWARGTS